MAQAIDRQETDELARSALSLVDPQLVGLHADPNTPYFESASALYNLGSSLVRIATLGDWGGDKASPNFRIVIQEDLSEAPQQTKKETRYTFKGGRKSNHKYGIPEIEEFIDTNEVGQPAQRVYTSGRTALEGLRYLSVKRRERKTLRRAAKDTFNRDRLTELSRVIMTCGPHNYVPVYKNEE